VQYYVTLAGNTLLADDTQQDYANIYAGLYTDLTQLAMVGGISLFNTDETPQVYRDLFVALGPKTPPIFGGIQYKYSFDPATINGNVLDGTDGVFWGAQTETQYYGTGFSVVAPFNPGNQQNQIASCKKFFGLMITKGAPKWRGGLTAFEHDTSAYAASVTPPSTMAINDFVGTNVIVQHEVPIRSIWLAALQLTILSDDRFPKFQKVIYAGPQSYMGHRLVGNLSGVDGAMDQVRVQRMDATELSYLMQGVFDGAAYNWAVSSGNGDTPEPTTPPWLGSIPYDSWEVFVNNIILIAGLAESPVTLGYQDTQGSYVPLPWGTQFLPVDANQSSSQLAPIVAVECLRRYKVTCTDEGRGGRVFLYNAWSRSLNTYNFFEFDFAPSLPTTLNLQTFTDSSTNTVVAQNSSGQGVIADVFGELALLFVAMQPYTRFSNVTAEREVSAQMLTNLLRFVAPSPASIRFLNGASVGPVGTTTATVKRSGSLKKKPEILERFLKAYESRQGSRTRAAARKGPGSYTKLAQPLQEPASNLQPFMLGLQGAIGSRRPNNVVASKFFSLPLPITYANVDPSTPSLNSALLPGVTRLGVYTFSQVQDLLLSYYEKIALAGGQTTYRAEADIASVELLQIFLNRTNAGLGGAAGSLVEKAFGLGKKDKVKKAGKILGPIVDAVVNAFPRGRAINEKAGKMFNM